METSRIRASAPMAQWAPCSRLVEQSAYVWYAQDAMQDSPMPVEQAAEVVSRIWYTTFFGAAAEAGKCDDRGRQRA
ncbi:hypothetical protein ACFTZB_09325 [Rhodococcus sp. NPDC057014]|uniref:hypothetical protein n=1 Tax=Rhodococcus sp. NPDC057014 TaxID=3346000 RepID=UPI00362C8CF3